MTIKASYSREAVNDFVTRVQVEGGEAKLIALWTTLALTALRDDERIPPAGCFHSVWMNMAPWEKANVFDRLTAVVRDKGHEAFCNLVKKARAADRQGGAGSG